ncbi:T9SS type A sorting domain-containing protein [candidate division KSB1 bacterium]|nr:T9SS type A sorting domain-containing protein [candidate division KSB1 bacterium]NIS27375.1 T9SS type A sorting domain-containing protein [candidate division KSB1 bacterium]NIT74200.1 T9SS type A sorting domain-containing protein [candidate division KSB1 bacterium]NIU28092.1 T9SS type A sorting domain-containing protein [candidate division KSB1 bacterium]NIU90237.1 T9SS type A sorting domain-containing protein [candidate division KSB1 bacterium]
MVTSVEDVPTEMIPQDYALEQNYPNPFNPSTTIKFSLKEAGHVNMTIYNAIGEKVMEVIDGQMNAGRHDVTIRSDGLTSGLYFYRIQVNGFSSVKKMILMK